MNCYCKMFNSIIIRINIIFKYFFISITTIIIFYILLNIYLNILISCILFMDFHLQIICSSNSPMYVNHFIHIYAAKNRKIHFKYQSLHNVFICRLYWRKSGSQMWFSGAILFYPDCVRQGKADQGAFLSLGWW